MDTAARTFAPLFALVLLLAPPFVNAASPNIVLFLSDDQGYSDLGFLGEVPILTPHLDRIAREGIRLTHFYVAWPACTPSRGALLTGRYPQRNGTYDMYRNEAPDFGHRYEPADYRFTFERVAGMDTREVLLPSLLETSGYTSGIFGKWDLGIHRRFLPLARGFERFFGFVNTGVDYYTHERYGVPAMYRDNEPTLEAKGTYATSVFESHALQFLEDNHDRPFFLYVPFNAPHNSSSLDPVIRTTVQAPDEFRALYPPVHPETETRPSFGKYPPGEVRVTTRAARTRDYRASVTAMDAAIGNILAFLDTHDLAENTLVLFFSDNGGSGGSVNAPLRGGKSQLFEGGIRVPFLARWPAKIPPGSVSDAFLSSLEIVPTILNATATPLPEDLVLDGFDMLPVLQGLAPSPRDRMFWQRRDDRAARVGSWKWVDSEHGSGLFDLASDIGESTDLSTQHPEILSELQAAFQEWVATMDQAEPRGPFRDF